MNITIFSVMTAHQGTQNYHEHVLATVLKTLYLCQGIKGINRVTVCIFFACQDDADGQQPFADPAVAAIKRESIVVMKKTEIES